MNKVNRFEDYVAESNGLKITVIPEIIKDRTSPENKIFSFQYTVNIENLSKNNVQLINRHWKIFSANRQTADVKGEGVVGLQPLVEPLQAFQYSSWATIDTEAGYMEGSYTFKNINTGEFFDAEIPRFDLLFFDETKMQ